MQLRSMEVFYLTLPVDNADQALSLSEYLNQHGIIAAPEGNDSVICPMDDPAKTVLVHQLRKSWEMYWDHSDAALFGLPVMIKVSDGGCAHCGTGPRVE
jgi:hypothetical protein